MKGYKVCYNCLEEYPRNDFRTRNTKYKNCKNCREKQGYKLAGHLHLDRKQLAEDSKAMTKANKLLD